MRRQVPFVFVIFFALCFACDEARKSNSNPTAPKPSEAQALIEARVDQAQVRIGDRVTFTVEVRHDADVEVVLPPVLEMFANAIIHEAGIWEDLEDRGDRKRKSIRVVLDPGIGPLLEFPALELRWRETGLDDWSRTTSELITVEVEATTAEDSELIEPIDGFELETAPTSARDGERRLVYLAILGGVCLFFAGMAWLLFRKKKARPIVLPDPDEVARRELDRLSERGLIEAGRFREYYYGLTGILARYISDRFGLAAPERTTEEFLDEMRRAEAIPTTERATLEEFLESADMVKYARMTPPREEAARATETARRFVESTKGPRSEEADHVALR